MAKNFRLVKHGRILKWVLQKQDKRIWNELMFQDTTQWQGLVKTTINFWVL